MQVRKNMVVLLDYELFSSDGELIEKTDEPIEYLHGGYDGIFAAVEKSLQGKNAGESCEVYLQPADAFGDYDAALVQIEATYSALRQARGLPVFGYLPGAMNAFRPAKQLRGLL